MASKRWAVALSKNVTPLESRKASRYRAEIDRVFRKFDTRDEARFFAANDKRDLVVVDTFMWEAVR